MRPVNLIPQEERIGTQRPLRSGPTAYVIVGALVIALLGVTTLVVTNGKIDELKTETEQVQSEIATTESKAQELAAYVQFQSVREQRVATVTSLADSRFDWERVMRELALILPDDILFTALTASASPGVSPAGGASVALRSAIPGPALAITGCTRDQESVAGFVQALKDIDGATRVGLSASSNAAGEGAATDSGSGSSSEACNESGFAIEFQLVVAFDAAPLPATTTEAAPVAPSSPEAEATAEE